MGVLKKHQEMFYKQAPYKEFYHHHIFLLMVEKYETNFSLYNNTHFLKVKQVIFITCNSTLPPPK